MNAITEPQDFIKFSATRHSNSTGTRDYGEFQIHSSRRLFHVFFQKLEDGSTIGNYHGNEATRIQLIKEKAGKVSLICSLYGVGGQSLTCDEGLELKDGSFFYSGSYDCWSD